MSAYIFVPLKMLIPIMMDFHAHTPKTPGAPKINTLFPLSLVTLFTGIVVGITVQ